MVYTYLPITLLEKSLFLFFLNRENRGFDKLSITYGVWDNLAEWVYSSDHSNTWSEVYRYLPKGLLLVPTNTNNRPLLVILNFYYMKNNISTFWLIVQIMKTRRRYPLFLKLKNWKIRNNIITINSGLRKYRKNQTNSLTSIVFQILAINRLLYKQRLFYIA